MEFVDTAVQLLLVLENNIKFNNISQRHFETRVEIPFRSANKILGQHLFHKWMFNKN